MGINNVFVQDVDYLENLHKPELWEFLKWMYFKSYNEGILALELYLEDSIEYKSFINCFGDSYSGFVKALISLIGIVDRENIVPFENVFYFLADRKEKPSCYLLMRFILDLQYDSVCLDVYSKSLGIFDTAVEGF